MWTRKTLKANAKKTLKKNFRVIFYAYIINTLISMGVRSFQDIIQKNGIFGFELIEFAFLGLFFMMFFSFFLSFPIQIGMCRLVMEARQNNNPGIGTLFWAFKKGRYWPVMTTMLRYYLHIFIGILLFFIPGIITYYSYRYVPYILAENPKIKVDRVLRLSKEMTRGEKFKIFKLDISFIGWFLIIITITVLGQYLFKNTYFVYSFIFLLPYFHSTLVELYAFVRERSIENNIINAEELTGFDNYEPYNINDEA